MLLNIRNYFFLQLLLKLLNLIIIFQTILIFRYVWYLDIFILKTNLPHLASVHCLSDTTFLCPIYTSSQRWCQGNCLQQLFSETLKMLKLLVNTTSINDQWYSLHFVIRHRYVDIYFDSPDIKIYLIHIHNCLSKYIVRPSMK